MDYQDGLTCYNDINSVMMNVKLVYLQNMNLSNQAVQLAFNTGMVKPAVLPKQVLWVWVRSRFLAHHDIPCTHNVVLWVWTGKLQQGDPNFSLIFPFFTSVFSVNSGYHTMTEPNMA